MKNILEVIDATQRLIYLTNERWLHINEEHPEVSSYFLEFENTLRDPDKITSYSRDIAFYYKYFKNKISKSRHLLILVKYLNGKGFIITAYFVRNVK